MRSKNITKETEIQILFLQNVILISYNDVYRDGLHLEPEQAVK